MPAVRPLRSLGLMGCTGCVLTLVGAKMLRSSRAQSFDTLTQEGRCQFALVHKGPSDRMPRFRERYSVLRVSMGFVLNFLNRQTVKMTASMLLKQASGLTEFNRCYVLLLVPILKKATPELPVMMDFPAFFKKEECYTLFSALLQSKQESEARVAQYRKTNMLPPEPMLRHMMLCDITLNLMMSSVAVGYDETILPSVLKAWCIMAPSLVTAPFVVAEIQNVMTEGAEDMSFFNNTAQWILEAQKFPSFLKNDYGHLNFTP